MILDKDSYDTIEIYNELNKTHKEMMYEAMEVHHITPEILKDKRELQDTDGYKKLIELNNRDHIFIAHDTNSDISMLKRDGISIEMSIIDTLRCTKHLFSDLDAYRLQYLRYRLGLYKNESEEVEKLQVSIEPHDALSDVIVMKILLDRLISEINKKYEYIDRVYAIEKLITLSSTPVKIEKFAFGKYKGEYIDEISHNDYRYLKWMYHNLELDEDMEYTLSLFL
jgi:DNA polymerase-3 subunit epsilon/exodeoxyribonuclease X